MSFYTAWVINRKAQSEHFSSAILSESGRSHAARNAAFGLVEGVGQPTVRAVRRRAALFDHLISAK
jgi:hypothetical protein